MPSADSIAAKLEAAAKANAAKPTLNFSAWDSASSAVQAKYNPVVPKSNILIADSRNAPGSNLSPAPAPASTALVISTPSGGSNGSGVSAAIPTTAVKVATPDIILVNQETLPVDLMTNLIFEDIGGQELISLSRHDLITGGSLEYQPITNLNDIAIQYNSKNIIPMPDSSDNYLANFPIDLNSHIIEEFSSTDVSHIKINSSNELEIQVTNVKFGEQIEVEILSSISTYNSTKFI